MCAYQSKNMNCVVVCVLQNTQNLVIINCAKIYNARTQPLFCSLNLALWALKMKKKINKPRYYPGSWRSFSQSGLIISIFYTTTHISLYFILAKHIALLCFPARHRAVLDATVVGGWNDGQPGLLSVQTTSRD